MTNREYLVFQLSPLGLDGDTLTRILEVEGIASEAVLDRESCDIAMYNQIGVMLLATTQNISEGGYSISWNAEGVKLFYKLLSVRLNKPNILDTPARPRLRWRSM